jgi:transcriptional regulator with XRE-family HTH domain
MDDGGRGDGVVTDETRRAFAAALVNTRRQAGMTQTELAERARITQTQISGYERGTIPDPPKMFALERALGVTPGTLSQMVGYMPVDAHPLPCTLTRAVIEDPALDDSARRAILAMYEALTSR